MLYFGLLVFHLSVIIKQEHVLKLWDYIKGHLFMGCGE